MTRLPSFPFGFPPRALVIGLSLLLWLGGAAVSPAADTTSGLVGYWTFEEGTGTTTADQTTNGFTGTFENVATWGGPTWTNSPLGSNALSFDGVNDRINIGNPPALQLTGALTLSAWVYVRQFSPNNGRIITKGGGSGSRGWALNVEGSSTPPNAGSFQVGGSPTATFGITTTTSLPSNQWVHLAGVYVPGVASRIYINGFLNNEVTTAVPATQNNTTLNVAIGGRPTGSVDTPWNGLIDEVRVFNRALTEEEIRALPELVQTPLTFVTQPVSRTVGQFRPVTFSSAVSGSPPHLFQWLTNGVPIDGANGPTYTIPSATLEMSGTAYAVTVANLAYSVTSSNAILTVVEDTNAPGLLSVGSADGRTVGLSFDEVLDLTIATDTFSYTVNDGSVEVASAVLRPDGKTVVLSLGGLGIPITGIFTVMVNFVTDLVGNPIVPDTTASGTVAGFTAADLNSPTQPGSTFSSTNGVFEMTAGGAEIAGTSDQGHVALKSVAGDFDVQVRVAGLTAVNINAKAGLMVRQSLDANSPTLHLLANPPPAAGRGWIEAGQRLTPGGATTILGTYTAAVMPDVWLRLRRTGDLFTSFRSTNGADWVPMAQTSQVFTDPVVVGLAATARNNSSAATVAQFQQYGHMTFSGASLAITQPTNTSAALHSTATFAVAATGTGAPASETVAYQWQREDGAGGFTNLPAATGPTLNFLVMPADQGAQFRARVYYADQALNSDAATLTVTPDVTPPTLLSVVSRGNATQVTAVFSEAVDAATAQDFFNYAITNAAGQAVAIISAALGTDGRTVTLTTEALAEEGGYFLAVKDVLDLGEPPNSIAAGTVSALFTFSSLVGYWALDEGAGTLAADQSGLGHSGTLANGPLWVPGLIGDSALNFDGVDDSVNLGNPAALQITGPLTLAAWVYPDTFTASGRIVAKGGSSGFRGWALVTESANTFSFAVGVSATANVAIDVPNVITTAWTHLAGVYDPTVPVLRLYTNGVLAGETTTGVPTSQFNASASVFIGRRNDGLYFDGRIDEVRIYTRALSAEAVMALAAVPPRFLAPTLSGGQIQLNWTGTGRLEWSPTVLGPWTPVTPAPAAPYSEAVVPAENRFFRLNANP